MGENRLPFVPVCDLQTEADAAFRMKLGLAGGRFREQRMEAWREHACVVGSLHVPPGRGLPASEAPPRPQHLSGRAEPARRKKVGPRSWPRLGSLPLGLGEGARSDRLSIGARLRATRPIGPCGFGHQIQRF